VKIDDSVAIAPGVILQADPHCQIIIRAGVCLGMGTILHAHHGNLEIQAGAILGAGVLVVGKGKIGANACVGSTTTVLNADIDPERVIAPGSVVGKIGREVAVNPQEKQVVTTVVTTELALINASIETSTPSLTSATPNPSTFVPPIPPAPAPSTFIPPAPLPLVNSTFVDPNPSNGLSNSITNSSNSQNSNSLGNQNLPSLQNSAPNSQENPANSSESSETKPEVGTENNHQFYGKNRLDRLLGTLMPQNKPLP
jgi:carbon dioxide concentrating mechanism protein CcmN